MNILAFLFDREYHYLVSYFHDKGNGRTIITTNQKLDTEDSIKFTEDYLKEENKVELIGIQNIIRIKRRST